MSSFRDFVNNLGRDAGRRYDTDRARRLTQSIHTKYHDDCKVCEHLKRGGNDIVPHFEQSIYE